MFEIDEQLGFDEKLHRIHHLAVVQILQRSLKCAEELGLPQKVAALQIFHKNLFHTTK